MAVNFAAILPQEVLSTAHIIASIQKDILSLSEESLVPTIESILQQSLLRTASGVFSIATNIFHLLELCPNQSSLFAQLASSIFKELTTFDTGLSAQFKSFFITNFISPHFNHDYAFQFMYDCCDRLFLSPAEIVKEVLVNAHRSIRGGYAIAFLPLVHDIAPSSFRDVCRVGPIDPPDFTPDFQAIRDNVRWGYRTGTIEYAVVSDDKALFARLLAENRSLPIPAHRPLLQNHLFSPVAFDDLFSMILFFGSIDCFRQFLAMWPHPNLVNDPEGIAACALIGRNIEIIRWVADHSPTKTVILKLPHLPALCHRLDLIEWLLGARDQVLETDFAAILNASARSNCVEIFLYALSRGAGINKNKRSCSDTFGRRTRER
jgi:hypothetical protein